MLPHRLPTALALAVCAACSALAPREPAALAVAPTLARAEHRVGTPLGAVEPPGAAERIDVSDAVTVEVSARWSEAPASGGDALAARSRLISAERGGEPIENRSALSQGGRVLRGNVAVAARDAQARTAPIATERLALPRGVTASLTLLSEDPLVGDEGAEARKELRLEIGRAKASGALTVALVLEDLIAGPLSEGAPAAAANVLRRESVVLEDTPALDGEPLVLVLPAPFRGGAARSLELALTLAAGALPEALARCRADTFAAEQRAGQRSSWLGSSAVSIWRRQRAALVFLAQGSGAELCGDIALSAEDALLDTALETITAQLSDAAQLAADGATLGWALERGSARFLAARAAEQPLEPELSAAVLRRTGELGRSPAALADLAERSTDLASFQRRLVEENLALLEDTHPGARLRAHDWLAARGLAPRGFDPLGSTAERRAALEAAQADGGGR